MLGRRQSWFWTGTAVYNDTQTGYCPAEVATTLISGLWSYENLGEIFILVWMPVQRAITRRKGADKVGEHALGLLEMNIHT